MNAPNAGLSPIDEAYGFLAARNPEAALQRCLAILKRFSNEQSMSSDTGMEPPTEPADALLLCAELVASAHPAVAKKAAIHVRDACVAAGDLPQAVAACYAAAGARDGGGPGPSAVSALVMPVAQAFAKGSRRLKDGIRKPPSLPLGSIEPDPETASLAAGQLQERAAAELQRVIERLPRPSTDSPVPSVPLFSTLPPNSLARLLALFTPKDLAAGDTLIHRGDDGDELYLVVRGMLEAFLPNPEGDVRLAALGPGAVVGEMALVSDAPRAASVRAVEPTRVLVVKKGVLEKEASREASIGEALAHYCRRRMLSNLINHSFALSALTREEKQRLLERFQTQTFETGAYLVEEGAEGPGLYLVAAGHVRVTRTDEDGDGLVVADLGPGEVVGEISLVLRRPASASVQALHATVALFLPAEDFQAVVADHPGLLQKLYGLAVDREDELRTVVAQQALELDDVTLL